MANDRRNRVDTNATVHVVTWVDCTCWQSQSSSWEMEAQNLGDTGYEIHNGFKIGKDVGKEAKEALSQRMQRVLEVHWFAKERYRPHA